jgi:hypothetical protein
MNQGGGGSELCLTIVGTPQREPLHEGMWFAAACQTKMVMQLAALCVTML